MTDLLKLTDPYERKARLYPALLCFMPFVIAIATSSPQVSDWAIGLTSILTTFGGIYLLSNLARDRGKALENRLFEYFGGIPSIVVLRYSNSLIPEPRKVRIHKLLEKLSGIKAPEKSFEKESPTKTDDIYKSWSDILRNKSRDNERYNLLFKENINYGFRRNLFSLKWHCVSSAIISLIILIFNDLNLTKTTQIEFFSLIFIILYISVFLFIINRSWVKVVAFEYAKRLTDTAEIIEK